MRRVLSPENIWNIKISKAVDIIRNFVTYPWSSHREYMCKIKYLANNGKLKSQLWNAHGCAYLSVKKKTIRSLQCPEEMFHGLHQVNYIAMLNKASGPPNFEAHISFQWRIATSDRLDKDFWIIWAWGKIDTEQERTEIWFDL